MKKYLKLFAAALLVAVAVEFFNVPAMATALRTLVLTTFTATTATITTLVATTLNVSSTSSFSGAIAATAPISISSATNAGVTPGRFRGAYTSAQIQALTPALGDFVYNTTVNGVCPSTGTGVGAFVMPSTTTTPTARATCY